MILLAALKLPTAVFWTILRGALVLAAFLGASGCGERTTPYRFRGPLVSSVNADRPAHSRRSETPATDSGSSAAARTRSPRPLNPSPRLVGTNRRSQNEPNRNGISAADSHLANRLRAFVGLRRRNITASAFVIEAAAAIGATLAMPKHTAVSTGPAADRAGAPDTWLDWARSRAAVASRRPLLGDLVVFDRVRRHRREGASTSSVGMVISVRSDETVEFVYLARGVVRRGFVNLAHPDQKRDSAGQVLNTIMRQRDGHGRRGAGDLSANLFASYLGLAALTAPPAVSTR